jgi:sterol desaturase/sphingolipid hydroxylase (fatty acid hydroxylase superfamily)
MTPNYIAFAIPFFLLLIGLEVLAARRGGRRVYRLADSLADLGCGIGQQVAMVFATGFLLAAYEWLYVHARLVTFAEGSPLPWIISFVFVDVAYYWWHRASHEVNFLWAVHAVHHQSEDYNLAVALRQAVLSGVTSLPFYAPMAFLGVPTAVYATMVASSTLYQFWIHTELVRRLGPAEAVLNTPSHHRVHHGVNPRYLDRNYGAILIVWDRVFGSFAEERERPVYGVTKPIRSFNPVWAQVQAWAEIAEKGRRFSGLDRLRIWWKSPAWSPAGSDVPGEDAVQARAKHEAPPAARTLQAYAFVQFAPLVAATFVLLLLETTAPLAALGLGALFVFWTLLTVGGLLDGRRWAVPAEIARLACLAAAVAAFVPLPAGRAPLAGGGALVAAAMAAWLVASARRSPSLARAGSR